MLKVKIRFIFRPTVMMSNVIEQAEAATRGVKQGVFKKRLQHSSFPVKFAKFLRTAVLKNIYTNDCF